MRDRAQMTSEQLEVALVQLGSAVDFPPTPNLSAVVGDRLRQERASSVRVRRTWPALPIRRSLVLAVALLLVLATVAIGLALGVPGLRIVPVESLPPTPTSTTSETPGPLGSELGFRNPAALADAQRDRPFVMLPTANGLSQPDAVYVETPPVEGRVELVYGARPDLPAAGTTRIGLLITEFQGSTTEEYMQKMVHGGTPVELTAVAGARAWWIGGPHVLIYNPVGHSGGDQVEEAPSRLAGNTLVWERDGAIYRVESALSKEQAVAIAESMR